MWSRFAYFDLYVIRAKRHFLSLFFFSRENIEYIFFRRVLLNKNEPNENDENPVAMGDVSERGVGGEEKLNIIKIQS